MTDSRTWKRPWWRITATSTQWLEFREKGVNLEDVGHIPFAGYVGRKWIPDRWVLGRILEDVEGSLRQDGTLPPVKRRWRPLQRETELPTDQVIGKGLDAGLGLTRMILNWLDRRKWHRRSSLQIVWWFFDSLGDYVVNLQGSKAKWQTLRRWRWRQSRSNIDNVLQLFYFM